MLTELGSKYTHVQSVSLTEWVIVHNLNTLAPIVNCWIDGDNSDIVEIVPLSTVATDLNTATITFSNAITGTAVLL